MSDESDAAQMQTPVLKYLLLFASVCAAATFVAAVNSTGWLSCGVILWPAALFSVGMLLGFLFGVPKVVAASGNPPPAPPAAGAPGNPAPAPAAAAAAPPAAQSPYSFRPNTNLEEISDWLTKIVVGVTLVELKSTSEQLDRFAAIVADSFHGDPRQSHSIGMAIAIVFPALGFLVGYVGTRRDLQSVLMGYIATRLGMMSVQLNKTERLAETAVASAVTGVGKRKSDEKPGAVDEAALAARQLWHSDPWQGFGGGQYRVNGRELSATIEPLLGDAEAACRVHLEVRSIDPTRPLAGSVKLHLHPTFDEPDFDVPVVDGLAQYDIVSFGVFTVAAEADGGQTRLALNLRTVPGGSTAFYEN